MAAAKAGNMGGGSYNQPQQSNQGGNGGGYNQAPQQNNQGGYNKPPQQATSAPQAPKEPDFEFDDDIPF